MKILLTGHPGVGKSTVIHKVVKTVNRALYGIIAQEIRDEVNNRVGFTAQNSQNEKVIFAHKTLIKSNHLIGGKYYVDVDVINNFVVPELKKGLEQNNTITIIDEIGRMQSLSDQFIKTTEDLFNSQASFLGTIVLDPEPWSLQFKNNKSVLLIEVTKENREDITNSLSVIFSNIDNYYRLDRKQQNFVKKLLKDYFSQGQFIQIQKLFNNALYYVNNNKVKSISTNNIKSNFIIEGKTNNHHLSYIKPNKYQCDCDLFTGIGIYKNKQGECSHIQSVKILDNI